MTSSVCGALHIDKDSIDGKLILIEEHHGSDANFVISCMLANQLQKESGICFLMLHNSFEHYNIVGTKLGYNLRSLQEKEHFVPLELFQTVTPPCEVAEMKNLATFLHKDPTDALKKLFNVIRQTVSELSEKREHVCLVVDDLSDLLLLGAKLKDVWSFFQYCRTLLAKYPRCSIIVLCHVSDDDDALRRLCASVAHVADIEIMVNALATGKCKDISGVMKINWRDTGHVQKARQWNKQGTYHFKLEDRRVKMFAPGTAASLV